MTYLVFDSETQTHKSHKRTANPFHPDNYVVLRGWKEQGDKRCSAERFEGKTPDNYLRIGPRVKVLVGHNIKFDLLYEMCNDNPDLKAFFKRGGIIWCTQYAEYLIRNQEQAAQMCSLDSIIEMYGGRLKTDGIKELWDAGVQTSDIDPDLLLDYLIGTKEEGRNSGDIGNTEKVFLGQIKEAKALGMIAGIKLRMDGLLATTEMEFRGLKIDVPRAKRQLHGLTEELKQVEADLHQYIADIPEEVGFNWNSGVHNSALIFGGTIKYQKSDTYIDEKTGDLARLKAVERQPVFEGHPIPLDNPRLFRKDANETALWYLRGPDDTELEQDTFKSGKKKGEGKFKNMPVPGELKTKIQDFFYELPGHTEPNPEWAGKQLDGAGNPVYSTGSEVIEKLANRNVPFLKKMGRLLALNKEIGTYYVRYDPKRKMHVGMLTCVQKDDHIVHHSLNHTNTVTTRLSANDPNAQNLKTRGSEVKGVFTTRFGEDGQMVEADYSQLEVVVQGLLSGDKNLVADLNDRIDFHCKRVSAKFGCTYEEALVWCKDEEKSPDYAMWKDRRTGVKEFSFQRAYGAGAAAIAESTGMPIDDIKKMIELEDAMYPNIGKFNARVEAEVNRTAEPFRDGKRGWRVFRKGTWQAPTGTIYGWRSYDAPKWMREKGITDTFKPTELKNYPVQGTGGEIVQMILGILWRWFVKTDNFNNRAFLVNTVHDCVWVDCHKDVVPEVARGMKVIMESVPIQLKRHFGIDCPVPFPVDVEQGNNMLEMHHVEGL